MTETAVLPEFNVTDAPDPVEATEPAAEGEGKKARTMRKPSKPADQVQFIPLGEIIPNPNQPRKHFDDEDMKRFASNIRQLGVIQPIIVTTKNEDGKHIIIAGERRFRASEIANKKDIPAIVRDVKPEEIYALSASENLTRTDMTPYEEASVYKFYRDEKGQSDRQISTMFGKHRTHVNNMLGLLDLPSEVVEAISIADSGVTMGHARALKGLKDAPEYLLKLLARIKEEGLSVRWTEEQVKAYKSPSAILDNGEAAGPVGIAPGVAPAEGENTPVGEAPVRANVVEDAKPAKVDLPEATLKGIKFIQNALKVRLDTIVTTDGELKLTMHLFGGGDLARLMNDLGCKDEGLKKIIQNTPIK